MKRILIMFLLVMVVGMLLVDVLAAPTKGRLGSLVPFGDASKSAKTNIPVVFRGFIEGDLRQPLAVAVNEAGEVFVADSGNGVVKRFGVGGALEVIIGKKGENVSDPREGDLFYPVGIAIGPDRNVYVSDLSSARISVFDQNGAFLSYFGDSGDGGRPFAAPVGIHYQEGRFYVNDVKKSKVLIFNEAGTIVGELGKGYGYGPGELAYASYLCTDKEGGIWVSDSNNSRIQVFNRSGNITNSIPLPLGDDGIGLPRGLHHDQRGNMHVANVMAHRVDVFDIKGKNVYSYGESGRGPGQFGFPNGVGISGRLIYVTDVANSRVHVWEYTG